MSIPTLNILKNFLDSFNSPGMCNEHISMFIISSRDVALQLWKETTHIIVNAYLAAKILVQRGQD